jgi:NAD(P)-dependent dehydrogenase (short-subunit alcohol dehydrogenase family)
VTWRPPDLSGAVALVTGASRGVGRGVALALGDARARVYVTGRSVRGGPRTEDLPGTVEDTADEVTARGGQGIAVRCDHTVDADVDRLFERIAAGGRLDVLVNNAWAGYERAQEGIRFDAPFWDQPLWRWDLFFGSLRGQFVASRLAAPLMLAGRWGLIVNVSFTDGETPLGQTAYDVVKQAADRMAMDMALELRRHEVAAVALHPGLVRTERVQAAWDLLGEGPAQIAHSVEYVGRSIAHLAVDPSLMELSGSRLAVGDLALRYGFDDVDGRRPAAFHLEGRMSLATRMERLNRVTAQAQARGVPG